ncbi:MAG: hypothetical protein ACLP5H_29750 [Desulfomonilaceae bacterium]
MKLCGYLAAWSAVGAKKAHGKSLQLQHTSISEAVRKTQAIGMDVTKVLKFSRHKNLNTLQVYIDGLEGAQGEIAELVATD